MAFLRIFWSGEVVSTGIELILVLDLPNCTRKFCLLCCKLDIKLDIGPEKDGNLLNFSLTYMPLRWCKAIKSIFYPNPDFLFFVFNDLSWLVLDFRDSLKL